LSNSNSSSSSSSGGVGFAGLLTIVFIVLKLLHKIDWSWWWVLSPMWISFALTIGILLLIAAIWLIVQLVGIRKSKKRARQVKERLAARDPRRR
jgi:hypothetical protein